MFMYQQQIRNELEFAKENKAEVLRKHKSILLAPCLTFIEEWLLKPISFVNDKGEVRADLIEIYPAIHKVKAEEVIWNILSTVLLEGQMTLQAVMSMYFEQIEVEMAYRKGRVLEPFIQAVMQCPHVQMKKVGKYLNLVCLHPVKIDTSSYSYVLPSLVCEPVETNKGAGYENIPFHVITGGKLKQHDGELCLDHINRMNNTAYTVDMRLFDFIEPEFEKEPKFLKKKRRYENKVEIAKREKQFNIWFKELPMKLGVLVGTGNKFFYRNRYCVRGRTYIKAWHLDYIGNKFMRAVVNTTRAEAIDGVEDYI